MRDDTEINPREFIRLQVQVDSLQMMVCELRDHVAQVEALRAMVTELRTDMRTVLATLDGARGGWRTLLMLGGASGAIGALLAKLVHMVPFK